MHLLSLCLCGRLGVLGGVSSHVPGNWPSHVHGNWPKLLISSIFVLIPYASARLFPLIIYRFTYTIVKKILRNKGEKPRENLTKKTEVPDAERYEIVALSMFKYFDK